MTRELFRGFHKLLQTLESRDSPSIVEQSIITQIQSIYVREASEMPLLEDQRLQLVSYMARQLHTAMIASH